MRPMLKHFILLHDEPTSLAKSTTRMGALYQKASPARQFPDSILSTGTVTRLDGGQVMTAAACAGTPPLTSAAVHLNKLLRSDTALTSSAAVPDHFHILRTTVQGGHCRNDGEHLGNRR